MTTVSFTRGKQSDIEQLQTSSSVQDGALYIAKDTGAAYIGLENNVLVPIKVSVQDALSVDSYVIAEGDTSDNVWHYRFYSNGYVEYDGTLTVNDVYFAKKVGSAFYGSSQEDILFPYYPVQLSTISFKKAEAFPAALTTWVNMGQNIITTLSSAPHTSPETGKYTTFGVMNCFRTSALTKDYTQDIVYGVKTSGYVLSQSEVHELETQQAGLYKAKILDAVSKYNNTQYSQEVNKQTQQ